jgi:hypothetical protein
VRFPVRELQTVEAQQARIDALYPEEEPILISPASSTPGSDYLEAIVRDPRQEKHFRARCARDLLAYERPRLAVTAITTPQGFAERLEAAIARSEAAKVVEATCEAPVNTPVARSLPPVGPEPTPLCAPMARLRRV